MERSIPRLKIIHSHLVALMFIPKMYPNKAVSDAIMLAWEAQGEKKPKGTVALRHDVTA